MATILTNIIIEAYERILIREQNGWDNEPLSLYSAGVTNTFNDLVLKLYFEKILSDEDYETLNEVLEGTLDTLDY